MTWLLMMALAAIPAQTTPEDALVIRGVVTSVSTRDSTQGLTTTYDVAVEEVLRGTSPMYIQVTLPGGILDGKRMALANIPVWKIGDDVVATLLSDASAPSWGQYLVLGEVLQPVRDGGPGTVAALEDQLRHSVHR